MIPKTPNLAVIDYAIRLIEADVEKYSCCALSAAECKLVTNEYDFDSYYRYQYEQYILNVNNYKLPKWWEGEAKHKKARIKALEGFKQACIDAGSLALASYGQAAKKG